MNMAKETVSLDDIQVQTNLCYQTIDRKQIGQREQVKSKQGISKRKDCIETSELQMHPNTCYEYQHHNIYYREENSSNQLQHQTKNDDQSNDSVEKHDTINDLVNIQKCLYIMAPLIVVLLVSTMVAIVLSAVTYIMLSESMHGETSSVTAIENDTISIQTQINEIQKEIPQALIQLNSTEIAIMELQIKLDEVKMTVPQVLFQLEEASRDLMNTSEVIIERATMQTLIENLQVHLYCGAGEWSLVAHLNMSDPTENCPPIWMEYTSDRIRACKRPISPEGSCPGIVYPINTHQYSKVCGRVIGYQFGSTDGFSRGAGTVTQFTIDQPYVDGISITHGSPRRHIWSYAVGASEQIGSGCTPNICPCSGGPEPPSYVGNNYYCESAFQGNCFAVNMFFPNDPLWDGQQCDNEGTCCTGTNTPLWFNVDLGSPTSDDIEVRICHNQGSSDEDSPVELFELYVQ